MSKSLANLGNYGKDRKVKGDCIQCGRRSTNISEQLMMCDDCLFKLQYASTPPASNIKFGAEKPKPEPPHEKGPGKVSCKYCYTKVPVDMVNPDGICFDCHTPPTEKVAFQAKASKLHTHQVPNR